MNRKILLYAVLGLLIFVLLVFTLFPNMTYVIKDFGGSDNGRDICTAPEGTSQEDWEEHMSHHPNMYAECFE